MAGRLFDLRDSKVLLPDVIIVDTNLTIERILAPLFAQLPESGAIPTGHHGPRAVEFFERLRFEHSVGLVTPTSFGELVHTTTRLLLKQYGAQQEPKVDWKTAYKRDSSLIASFGTSLRQLPPLLQDNRLMFVPPDELGPLEVDTTFDLLLLDLCCKYSLDTGDALILMEARRLGIDAIATLDRDMHRAAVDFDIYSWM